MAIASRFTLMVLLAALAVNPYYDSSVNYVAETVSFTAKELDCLARNIYHEARGESEAGQLAVAHVVFNRMRDKRWPSSICGVVYQKKQFSWTWLKVRRMPLSGMPQAQARWVALHALTFGRGGRHDPTNGANFYHEIYLPKPSWARRMKVSAVIGNHIFYKG